MLNNLNLSNMPDFIWQHRYITLAFVAGFIISYFKGRHRNWRHYNNVRRASKIYKKIQSFSPPQVFAYLRKIDPFVFEELLLTAIQRKGCEIIRNKRYTGDGGVDGAFWYKGELWLIQAKRYTGEIKRQHVDDFISLVRTLKCRGVFIHTGKTPATLINEVAFSGVFIVSGDRLLHLFRKDGKNIFE